MPLFPTARGSLRQPVSNRIRTAIACGLALGGAATLFAGWEWLRCASAETKDTRRLGLRGTHIRAGPFAIFMRVPARPRSEAASVLLPVVLVHGLVVSGRM